MKQMMRAISAAAIVIASLYCSSASSSNSVRPDVTSAARERLKCAEDTCNNYAVLKDKGIGLTDEYFRNWVDANRKLAYARLELATSVKDRSQVWKEYRAFCMSLVDMTQKQYAQDCTAVAIVNLKYEIADADYQITLLNSK